MISIYYYMKVGTLIVLTTLHKTKNSQKISHPETITNLRLIEACAPNPISPFACLIQSSVPDVC